MILIWISIRIKLVDYPQPCAMYVCLCKAVTDRQIRETISEGATTFAEIRRQLGVATQCGKCCQQAKSIVETSVKKQLFSPAA